MVDNYEREENENSKSDSDNYEFLPVNSLEYEYKLTEPEWGKLENISSSLKKRLGNNLKITAKNTDGSASSVSFDEILWEQYAMFTRDIRLGNLDNWEIQYTNAHINFSGDCLSFGFKESFKLIFQRPITTLETSQSKKGFLRKLFKTRRKEESFSDSTQVKKGLFGQQKNGDTV